MDFYVRFFEDQLKQPGDNPTIGLILCTEKNMTIYQPYDENRTGIEMLIHLLQHEEICIISYLDISK